MLRRAGGCGKRKFLIPEDKNQLQRAQSTTKKKLSHSCFVFLCALVVRSTVAFSVVKLRDAAEAATRALPLASEIGQTGDCAHAQGFEMKEIRIATVGKTHEVGQRADHGGQATVNSAVRDEVYLLEDAVGIVREQDVGEFAAAADERSDRAAPA